MVRVDDGEYAELTAKAAAARVTVQRLLVETTLAAPRRPAQVPQALIDELTGLRLLSARIGGNLNQVARALNSGARPDPRVIAAMDSVRRVMRRIDRILSWPGIPPQRNVPGSAPA